MKRLLLPLLAALALPTAVEANIDPKVHKICKDVRDYMGCVKANKKIKVSIFDGLSKKEKKFLKVYLKNKKLFTSVPSVNGNWVSVGSVGKFNNFVNTSSVKRVGTLVSIKRCMINDDLDKELCNKGGDLEKKSIHQTNVYVFNCKKKLIFNRGIQIGYPSLDTPPEWTPFKVGKFQTNTGKIACKY